MREGITIVSKLRIVSRVVVTHVARTNIEMDRDYLSGTSAPLYTYLGQPYITIGRLVLVAIVIAVV